MRIPTSKNQAGGSGSRVEGFAHRFSFVEISQAPFSAAPTTITHRARMRNPTDSVDFRPRAAMVSAWCRGFTLLPKR
jgi:hypothetical protein